MEVQKIEDLQSYQSLTYVHNLEKEMKEKKKDLYNVFAKSAHFSYSTR